MLATPTTLASERHPYETADLLPQGARFKRGELSTQLDSQHAPDWLREKMNDQYHGTAAMRYRILGDPRIKATGLQIANARGTTSDGRDDLELIVRRLHSGALLIATDFRTELK